MIGFGSGLDFRVGIAVNEFSKVNTCKISEDDYIEYGQLVQAREF